MASNKQVEVCKYKKNMRGNRVEKVKINNTDKENDKNLFEALNMLIKLEDIFENEILKNNKHCDNL